MSAAPFSAFAQSYSAYPGWYTNPGSFAMPANNQLQAALPYTTLSQPRFETFYPSISQPKPTAKVGISSINTQNHTGLKVHSSYRPIAQIKKESCSEKHCTLPTHQSSMRWRYLAEAAMLFTIGMLTHQLPVRTLPGRSLLPTDWKAYLRVATGILAVNQLNKGMDWKPPVWLQAMETVGVIHALMVGFSKRYFIELGIMAPLVAGVVSAANYVDQKIASPLEEEAKIPKLVTKIIVSTGFTLASILVFPKVVNAIGRWGILGKAAQATAKQGKNVMFGSMIVGANCGCGNVICISLLGDIVGGFGNWIKAHFGNNTGASNNAS